MDLDDIRALLSVIDHRSVQAAARATKTSRTSLRRRIDALEARVGVPLLVRDVAGAIPTAAGEALAERGRGLVEEAAALLTAVRSLDVAPEGLIRIRMPPGLHPLMVGLVFSAARVRFPKLEIRLSIADDPLREMMDDVDLVFHFGAIPEAGAWISTTLVRAPERLVASPAYLAEMGTPTTVEELERHVLLSWQPPGGDARRWPLLDGGWVNVSPVAVSADIHLVRQFAATGHGIAYLPDAGVSEAPDIQGSVVPVLEGLVGRPGAMRALMAEPLARQPKGRLLLEMLRELSAVLSTL